MNIELSRRSFLRSTAATGIGLSIGFAPGETRAMQAKPGTEFTPFVRIMPDGSVVAIIKHFEGGQGTATGLSALIAEEMNMPLQDIKFEMAPSDSKKYANLFFGAQGTGGSSSIANSFMQYRTAAAAVKEMLLEAAAAKWNVSPDQLQLDNGVIKGAENEAQIAEFIDAARQLDVPEKPGLKNPADFQVIGVDQKARLDTPAKIDGSARFSMDVQLENQMVVVIKRSPRLGGLVSSFKEGDAGKIQGFIRAAKMPNNKGVMIYAESTWAAFQAREEIDVEWDFSKAESRSSDELKAELMQMVSSDPQFLASETDLKSANEALAGADKIVEQDFYFPILAHAPMEAMGATIEPQADGGIILHDGAQSPTTGHTVMSKVLGLPMEKVQVNTLYAGGFFGRRSTPDGDYLVELALAFLMTDRTRPLKLQWSREDDITGGYYRPAYAHKVRVGLDKDGSILGWDHRIAGQSLFKGTFFEKFAVKDGVDNTSVEGVRESPYLIPNQHIGLTDQKGPTTPNWWRSVGHSHTGFVMECMMDLCARAAGQDPIDFRIQYLQGDDPDQKRMLGVILLAAEKSEWGGELPENHFRGIAAHKSFRSYVAEVCEISKDEQGAFKIEKVTAAVDCGIAVTPDVVRAQIEGGIGYGIGHAMRAELTLTDGEVDQSNFHDFETLRIYDLSNIETHIVQSDAPPTGVGEPGTPPAGPALANAIAASGAPLPSHLPMTQNGVKFS